ncbi:MAG TPA: hypothetical protein DHW65_03555 [Dehalococcoidia bacterium]|nr:PaaI family thioesterase [SAR202 cluster bacterium]HAA94763.1 hypothetical protein [Dehalococcoidia bacterium]HCL25407.1 hypothetical protein [Dehalococcoidia bacterium]
MPNFEPRDPDFEAKVRDSFGRQTAMQTLGAVMNRVSAGQVEIEMPYRAGLDQHQGVIHGGIVTAIIDTACSHAAYSLCAPGTNVSTMEYKVNFVTPARGERLVARGEVVRPGATVSVCKGDVIAYENGEAKLVATMLTTMMMVPGRPNLAN